MISDKQKRDRAIFRENGGKLLDYLHKYIIVPQHIYDKINNFLCDVEAEWKENDKLPCNDCMDCAECMIRPEVKEIAKLNYALGLGAARNIVVREFKKMLSQNEISINPILNALETEGLVDLIDLQKRTFKEGYDTAIKDLDDYLQKIKREI